METQGQLGDTPQIVEFEKLYSNLTEIKEISKMQGKLKIVSHSNYQIPLWKKLNFYSGSDPDPLYNKESSILQQFRRMFPHFYFSGDYIKCTSIQGNLLKLKKCYQLNETYFFITDDGYIYTTKTKDFDESGYMSESLTLFKTPLQHQKSSINISTKDGDIMYGYEGTNEGILLGTCIVPVSVQNKQQKVYVGNKSYIYKSLLTATKNPVTNENIVVHSDDNAIDLGLGEIKKILLDVNQNLLFIVSEDEDGRSNLHILDHKKLFAEGAPLVDEIKKIEGVIDADVFTDGDLALTKSDGKVDILNTNINLLDKTSNKGFQMKKIQVNKAQNGTKQEVIDSLGTGTISLDNNEISNKGNEDDEKIINWIWDNKIEINGVTLTFKELFDNAKTESDIEKIRECYHLIIKKNEKLQKVPELLKQIDKNITEKSNKIKIDNIYEEFSKLTDEFGSASDLVTLITIEDKLKKLKRNRGSIQLGILDMDKDLESLLKSVTLKIKEFQEDKKDEYEAEIQANFETIKEILEDIMNQIDISKIYTNEIYIATKNMIDYLPSESKEKFEKMLKQLVDNRRKVLRSESEKIKKEGLDKIETKKREIEEQIDIIKETLEDVDSIEEVEEYRKVDALVDIIKKSLKELPNIDAQQLEMKLNRAFDERIFKLRLGYEENKGVIKSLDAYGIDTMLYYNEEDGGKIDREIEGEEQSNGKIKLVIRLSNGEVHRYDKSLLLKEAKKYRKVLVKNFPIKFEMTWPEYLELQDKIVDWESFGKENLKNLSDKLLNEKDPDKRKEIKNEIKEIKTKYNDARYTEIIIERLIKQQKLKPRTKVPNFDPNFIVLDEEKEILNTLSSRLVDQKMNGGIETLAGGPGLGKTVLCKFFASVTNRELVIVQCSKMDINDLFFSTELVDNSTQRKPAEWIKQMQKPGSIILFDEIDKLSDDCFSRLHDLLDSRRTVNDPKDGTIQANPDCLFLGTMNTYNSLSNPINNRGRILEINYPSELNESFKISKYANNPTMKKMSFNEFEMLYEKYIVRGEPAPTNSYEKNIYNIMINIKHLLNVFTKLRELYDAEPPYVYELSYRDARQIFVEYNNKGDFKKAMENILIPKSKHSVIDDKNDQGDMARNAINEEMGL